MADPKIYAHTYWSHKGKYPEVLAAVQELIPGEGEVVNKKSNPALEKFRKAQNCYYDLYNNGLCNRRADFRRMFGFSGPQYREPLTPEIVNRVEDAIDEMILRAAKEQGISCSEAENTSAQDEIDRLSAELASNHAKLTAVLEKPKVQLTGQDGNVFSIIGRVTAALKNANQSDKAKEFTDKAFDAESYDEVLRLAMTYCDVS